MNQATREKCTKIAAALSDLKGEIEVLAEEEQEKFDNLSEGLQAAEKGQEMEAAAEALQAISNLIEEAVEGLEGF